MQSMKQPNRAHWRWFPRLAVLAGLLPAALAGGCFGPMASGTFDRTLNVSGPVQLELRGGSGHVQLRAGANSEVRIHGEYEVYGFGFESARREADDLATHPPIDQHGDVVRIGSDVERFSNSQVNYTIDVPAQTEARIEVGSANIDVSGIQGPLEVSAGSGHVSIHDVKEDVRVGTGSGTVDLEDIHGRVNAIVRSGGLHFSEIGGDVTGEASSGHISVMHARGRVEVHGGSGGVEVSAASQDLRATSSSGRVSISGDPAAGSYWDIRSRSGSVTLDIPQTPGYQLYAHTSSGRIHAAAPMTMEETSRRSLRGRVGDGSARIEVETRSGSIDVR
jgi:ferric-dicitrate binding protein FerR (iron transport regulator)